MAYFVSDMYWLQNMRNIKKSRENVFLSLINMGKTDEEIAAVAEKVQKRFEATNHSIRGDVLRFLEMRQQALVEYTTALRIDPEEKNWLNTVLYGGRRR